MKLKIFAITAALFLLTACSAQDVVDTAERVEETVDRAEDAVEDMVLPEHFHDRFEQPDPNTELIPMDEAEAIAMEHAGFTAEDVTDLRTRFETGDTGYEYDVEFKAGGCAYDYTIHAETGEILEYDVDGKTPAAEASGQTGMTQQQAEVIALEHAGFTAEQVTGLHSSYEIDDGIPAYEIEFAANGKEYDYNIHAETGEILSFDMDD